MTVFRQYNSGTGTWDAILAGPQGAAGSLFNYTINNQTGSSYTAVAADNVSLVVVNNSSANIFYIPTNGGVGYAIGTQLNITQIGSGQVTIQAITPATTTVLSAGSTTAQPKLRTQYSAATCIKIDTDKWIVVGDII